MSSSKSQAATDSAVKSKKDDRYENMLKKIDLRLDNEKSKKDVDNNDANDDDGFITESRNKSRAGGVSLMDLVSNLQNNEKATGNSNLLKSHLADLTQKSAFKEAPSTRMQEELDRKANYQIIKKDIQKWQGIIKKNRENPHLDLTHKTDNRISVNNNRKGLGKTALENKVENKLKELNLFQENDILNEEKEMLKKLNPDEAKRRQSELAKFKNLMFYKELKNKRVSKIKSRLFHKIKKKRELRQQQRLTEGMEDGDPALQLKELEELEKKRAEMRMGVRHTTQSKYAKKLLRYGNEKDAQQSLNDIAQFRKEILKKIDMDKKEMLLKQLENGDDELNDEEFKEKIMDELEEQLRNAEAEENEETEQPKDGKKKKLPGFMQRLKEQQKNASRREAEELLEKLKNTGNLDDLELSDEEEAKGSDAEDDEEGAEKKKKDEKKPVKETAFGGRKKFHKDTANPTAIQVEEYKKGQKGMKTQDILRSYINNQDEQPQIEINTEGKGSGHKFNTGAGESHLDRLEPKDIGMLQEEKTVETSASAKKNNKKSGSKGKDSAMVVEEAANNQDGEERVVESKSGKKSKNSSAKKDDLVSGLNFGGLKEKYNKGANNSFLNDEIEKFNEENKQDIYNDLANFQIVNSNIYNEDFAQEKEKLLEEELPPEPKQSKGWGSWTGLGIKEKKVDPKIQLEQRVKKINELQKKRQDGKLENVIINDNRSKNTVKYLVRDLPHPYRSTDQFEYTHSVPLGPEINSMKNYQRLNKSKVITKAGETILPIRMPKKYEK